MHSVLEWSKKVLNMFTVKAINSRLNTVSKWKKECNHFCKNNLWCSFAEDSCLCVRQWHTEVTTFNIPSAVSWGLVLVVDSMMPHWFPAVWVTWGQSWPFHSAPCSQLCTAHFAFLLTSSLSSSVCWRAAHLSPQPVGSSLGAESVAVIYFLSPQLSFDHVLVCGISLFISSIAFWERSRNKHLNAPAGVFSLILFIPL